MHFHSVNNNIRNNKLMVPIKKKTSKNDNGSDINQPEYLQKKKNEIALGKKWWEKVDHERHMQINNINTQLERVSHSKFLLFKPPSHKTHISLQENAT